MYVKINKYIYIYIYKGICICICRCICIQYVNYHVPAFPRGAYTAPAGRAAQGGRVGQRRLLDAGHGFLMG